MSLFVFQTTLVKERSKIQRQSILVSVWSHNNVEEILKCSVRSEKKILSAILSKALKIFKGKCDIACSRKKKNLGEMNVKWDLISNE